MRVTGMPINWQRGSLALTILLCFGVACFLAIPRLSKLSTRETRATSNLRGGEVRGQANPAVGENAKSDNKVPSRGGYSRSDAFKRMQYVLQTFGKSTDYGLVESEITYAESE